jgi:hypothetical protein
MNKKGLVFTVFMILISLAVLAYLNYVVTKELNDIPSYSIGERQFTLLKNYQNIDSELIDLDRIFLLASQRAILKLANNGGFSEVPLDSQNDFYGENGCGSYLGYPLWSNGDKEISECFPKIGYEYNDLFNKQLYRLLPKDSSHGLSYSVSVRPVQSFYEIVGSTGGSISFRTSIGGGTESVSVTRVSESDYYNPEDISVSLTIEEQESFVPAYTVTSYDACTALDYYVGYSGTYTSTSREEFNSFVAFSSPYIRFIKNAQGNAVQLPFGKKLLEVAKAWNQMEGGKAALALYSVSTGEHSPTSKHNLGIAADITGCYDKDGDYHDIKKHSATFTRCHDLIFSLWKGYGLFISHKECVMKNENDCASKASLIQSHSNHIHVQEG